MLKMTLLAATALVLASEGQAGPPASYDQPGQFEDGLSEDADTRDAMFDRGDYLPVEYRGEIIDDWKGDGLKEPESGFKWVRVGDRAYLINLTSGFIKDADSPAD